MATIRWKRADSYEEANNYIGANGEVVVDLAENRLWVYDGANAYVTAAFTQQDGRYRSSTSADCTRKYCWIYIWRNEVSNTLLWCTEHYRQVSISSDSDATDVGDLFQARQRSSGTSSSTHGYTAGGLTPAPAGYSTIDKFPFSSDTNAADVENYSIMYETHQANLALLTDTHQDIMGRRR